MNTTFSNYNYLSYDVKNDMYMLCQLMSLEPKEQATQKYQ